MSIRFMITNMKQNLSHLKWAIEFYIKGEKICKGHVNFGFKIICTCG